MAFVWRSFNRVQPVSDDAPVDTYLEPVAILVVPILRKKSIDIDTHIGRRNIFCSASLTASRLILTELGRPNVE